MGEWTLAGDQYCPVPPLTSRRLTQVGQGTKGVGLGCMGRGEDKGWGHPKGKGATCIMKACFNLR